MGDFHIEFGDEQFDSLEIDIEDIDVETDLERLAGWYRRAEELTFEIADTVEFNRSVERATDEWIWRAGRKIAWLKKGIRRIEQRMLGLGGSPPYRLNDGRSKRIQFLDRRMAQAKEALLSNNIPLPWERTK
jgi:hypothetical protein